MTTESSLAFFVVLRSLITLPLNRIMNYSPIPPPTARSLGFAALLIIVSAFTLSALLDISSLHYNNPLLQGLHTSEKLASHNEPRHNIWADLSVEETKELIHYLHTVPTHLNLTTLESSNPFSNYILAQRYCDLISHKPWAMWTRGPKLDPLDGLMPLYSMDPVMKRPSTNTW